jgi:hypothetical protein
MVRWLSLGENCLSQNILERHGLRTFATPYSHGRTNVDYALALESRNYAGLIDPHNLARATTSGTSVVRSTLPLPADPIFDASVSAGFEFTHHDVIANERQRESYRRKVERMLQARGRENVAFLYHHRTHARTDLARLMEKLRRFRSFYTSEMAQCWIVAFMQHIVPTEQRRVELVEATDGVALFTLHTAQMWSGSDKAVFWAHVDDDLISQMLIAVRDIMEPRLQPTAA